MSPTTWTERSAAAGAFQEGRVTGSGESDYYVDFLFEGTSFVGSVPAVYVERSAPAATYTERSAPSPAWTERSA